MDLNDRERILMKIIQGLLSTQRLCLGGIYEHQFKKPWMGDFVHFGGYDDRPIEKGDLVIGQTGSIGSWKIGYVYSITNENEMVIREIGSDRLCNYGNEKFIRIVGLREDQLWERDKYKFYIKVIKAFKRGAHSYIYRYRGMKFHGENEAEIFIGEIFGGIGKRTKPFSFRMKWNSRTSIKSILEKMIENGYGTREFEVVEEEENESV